MYSERNKLSMLIDVHSLLSTLHVGTRRFEKTFAMPAHLGHIRHEERHERERRQPGGDDGRAAVPPDEGTAEYSPNSANQTKIGTLLRILSSETPETALSR